MHLTDQIPTWFTATLVCGLALIVAVAAAAIVIAARSHRRSHAPTVAATVVGALVAIYAVALMFAAPQ